MGPLFHLVSDLELIARTRGGSYAPESLAREGFVHCAGDPVVALGVARSYFRTSPARLLVLQLEPALLDVPVRFEAPAPLAGGGSSHRVSGRVFPHVYGPIPLNAVVGAGWVEREQGELTWPSAFVPLAELVALP